MRVKRTLKLLTFTIAGILMLHFAILGKRLKEEPQEQPKTFQPSLTSRRAEDKGIFEPVQASSLEVSHTSRRAEDKGIFEPVQVSYQAALFNLSKFNPGDFTSRKPMIPHIIHQIWDSHTIPGIFKDWVKSIAEKHPHWQYWFWTVPDAECFLRKKHPDFLQAFQNYPKNIFRTDAFRYFALYDFGGVYIDLDVEALKPLDFWTYAFPVVISWENYEHSYFAHKKKEPNIMTTVLASRPKHPFFKMLQEDLVINASSKGVLDATGPFFLHNTYKKYLNNSTSGAENSTIMTIHPKYWLPMHGPSVMTSVSCRTLYKNLTQHGKILCDEWRKKNYANVKHPDSFLNHFWVHTNMWKGKKLEQVYQSVFHIKDVVPKATLVSDLFNC